MTQATWHSTTHRQSGTAVPVGGVTSVSGTVPTLTNGVGVLVVWYEQDTAQAVLTGGSAPTVGSDTFEYIGKVDGVAASTTEDIELWIVRSTASGTQTVTVNFADTGQDYAWEMHWFENVDQSTTYGTPVTAATTSGANPDPIDSTITTTAVESVIFCACVDNVATGSPATANGDLTERSDFAVATSTAGMACFVGTAEAATVGTYDVGATFTNSSSPNLGLIAVELLAATGGAYTSRLALLGAG